MMNRSHSDPIVDHHGCHRFFVSEWVPSAFNQTMFAIFTMTIHKKKIYIYIFTMTATSLVGIQGIRPLKEPLSHERRR
jgi:hypothetical protein